MLVLPGKCPECKGNLVLDELEMSLTCEDCHYHENTKDRKTFAAALDEAEEWGPKDQRQFPSEIGKLILSSRLGDYARETLEEAMRGLELEAYDLDFLKKFKLIKEGTEND